MARESEGRITRDQARGSRDEAPAHMEGFEQALALALDKASSNDALGTGDHEVEVHFGAHVSVTNPGVVNEYVVRLVSPN